MTSSTTYKNRWWILGVMCITLFIISIDNTVLNLALPSIATDFNATIGQLQWTMDAYTLVFASLLITTGALGDRYGRKRLLIIGLALFGVGSLGAAVSTSIQMLIAFRALLGVAGAMVMPSTLSILTNVFEDHKERAKAIAIWSSIFSIGAGFGPIIGGLLISAFHWSSVFYLNVPIVIIGIVGGLILTPESKDARTPKPDFPGVSFSIIGLITLIYATICLGENGWNSMQVWISLGISVVFLTAFGWWEKRSTNPMLPLEFFKIRSFSGANIALTLSAFAMMGCMYLYSQFFQSVEGYSPIIAALCMFPMTPFVFVSTMFSIRVNRRLGTRLTMCIGLILSGASAYLFSQVAALHTNFWWFLLIQLLNGCGVGLTMSPATSSIMNSLPPNRAGIGSAMNDTTRQLGGAIGIAILGASLNHIYRTNVAGGLTGIQSLSSSQLTQILASIQSAHEVAGHLTANVSKTIMEVSNLAFVQGIKNSFLTASAIMAVAAVAALLILPAHDKLPEKTPATSEMEPEKGMEK